MSDRNFRQMLEAQWSRGNFVCVGLDSEFGKIHNGLRLNQFFANRPDVANVIVEFNPSFRRPRADFGNCREIASAISLKMGSR